MPNDLPLYSCPVAERVNDMDSARYLTLQLGQFLSGYFSVFHMMFTVGNN